MGFPYIFCVNSYIYLQMIFSIFLSLKFSFFFLLNYASQDFQTILNRSGGNRHPFPLPHFNDSNVMPLNMMCAIEFQQMDFIWEIYHLFWFWLFKVLSRIDIRVYQMFFLDSIENDTISLLFMMNPFFLKWTKLADFWSSHLPFLA